MSRFVATLAAALFALAPVFVSSPASAQAYPTKPIEILVPFTAALFPKLTYNPQRDFDLLTVAVRTPNLLVCNPKVPANTPDQFNAFLNAEIGMWKKVVETGGIKAE